MKHGLILGKFYPVHKGHLYLIEEAKKNCDHLTILCSSLKRELIPGELRFQWLKDLVEDSKTKVVHVQDENPQFPEEHPHFWEIWKKTILNHTHVKPDLIFTSEEYGDPLANVLGVQHKLIDLNRNKFKVSATNIREKPMFYWEFIPEPIRPYFLKRVVLTGSESVGKTTLAEKLAKKYQTNWVPEYAREYLEKKTSPMSMDDFIPIAKGHINLEYERSKYANRFLFVDTDLVTTKVYLKRYYEVEDPFITKHASNLKYDLSLFLDIDIPWEPDALRDLGGEREQMKSMFETAMKEAKREYSIISGDFETREKKAVEKISELEKEPIQAYHFTPLQISLRSPK